MQVMIISPGYNRESLVLLVDYAKVIWTCNTLEGNELDAKILIANGASLQPSPWTQSSFPPCNVKCSLGDLMPERTV